MDDFEWDELKNLANLKKHGISFSEAVEIWDNPVFTAVDDRQNYGESREISIGEIKEVAVIVMVHTRRGGRKRIISARKANSRERKSYYEHLKEKERRDKSDSG